MSRRHADIWSHPGPYLVDPYAWPWSPMVKITFDLENSNVKVIVKVKSIGHIWGLEFNRYVCFSFRRNRNPLWLRYSKFHIWPRKVKVNVMAKVKSDGHIWFLGFKRYVCFSFCGNRTIFGCDITNSIFDLHKSRSGSNTMVTFGA